MLHSKRLLTSGIAAWRICPYMDGILAKQVQKKWDQCRIVFSMKILQQNWRLGARTVLISFIWFTRNFSVRWKDMTIESPPILKNASLQCLGRLAGWGTALDVMEFVSSLMTVVVGSIRVVFVFGMLVLLTKTSSNRLQSGPCQCMRRIRQYHGFFLLWFQKAPDMKHLIEGVMSDLGESNTAQYVCPVTYLVHQWLDQVYISQSPFFSPKTNSPLVY